MNQELKQMIFGNELASKMVNNNNNKKDKPNEFQKEMDAEAKTLHPLRSLKGILVVLSIVDLLIMYFVKIYKFSSVIDKLCPLWIFFIIPILTILAFIFLKEVKADFWISNLSASRVGSTYAKMGIKYITIDFDRTIANKDIKKLIQEMTDKSESYNYYLKKISSNFLTVQIAVGKKVMIPEKAIFDEEIWKSEKWNYIPLGICLTDKAKLGVISWCINDNEKFVTTESGMEYYKTIPSVSFLISGGTGSGKSVEENNIIRHINTFSDNIQGLLCDQKRVEFSRYTNLNGIKCVGLDIPTIRDCLVASRNIMYDRMKFMEEQGVNKIYDIEKGTLCDSYTLIGVDYSEVPSGKIQFDEIFYAKVNGEIKVTTIDKLFNSARNGDKVELYLLGQKDRPYICQVEGEKVREEYTIDGKDYSPDDRILVEVDNSGINEELRPAEIIHLLEQGKRVVIPDELECE